MMEVGMLILAVFNVIMFLMLLIWGFIKVCKKEKTIHSRNPLNTPANTKDKKTAIPASILKTRSNLSYSPMGTAAIDALNPNLFESSKISVAPNSKMSKKAHFEEPLLP